MVEGSGLENRRSRKGAVGSNPTTSVPIADLPDSFVLRLPERTASTTSRPVLVVWSLREGLLTEVLPNHGDVTEWPKVLAC